LKASVSVEMGEIVAVIGGTAPERHPLSTISGLVRSYLGTISWRGEKIQNAVTSHRRVRLAHCPEADGFFPA